MTAGRPRRAEQLASIAGGINDLTARATNDGPGLHHFEQTDAGPTLARSERFADEHPVLAPFVTTGLVVDHVAALLDEPVVLFKEKVNDKHPGGGGFAPHQDATAYRFVDHHVSAMFPLDVATVASGCLYFARGHSKGQLPTHGRGRVADEVTRTLDWQPVEAEPGDIVMFDRSFDERPQHTRHGR